MYTKFTTIQNHEKSYQYCCSSRKKSIRALLQENFHKIIAEEDIENIDIILPQQPENIKFDPRSYMSYRIGK